MSEETGKTEDGDAPLAVRADDFGDRFLIYKTDRGSEVELRLTQDTFWASQRQMAEAFGTTSQNITIHLANIFKERELEEASVCKESLHTGPDGKRYLTKLYDLNALIAVGYRIGGPLGTAFRLWAADKLIRYLTKGFVVDTVRLKQNDQIDRVSELREVVRDIRAAEANVYAELRRICALCQDYDPRSDESRTFYGQMQAKLYWASVSLTPSMVIKQRADAAAPQMGLTAWSKENPLQADVVVAKNFLGDRELRELNRLTTILLDIFEDQLEIGRLTLMGEARALLDLQLKNLHRAVLTHGGNVSSAQAEAHAKSEYRKFDEQRRLRRAQEIASELADLKAAQAHLPKPKLGRPRIPKS